MLFYAVIAISLMFPSLGLVFVSTALSLTSIAVLVENQGWLIEFVIGMSILVCYLKWQVSKALSATILSIGIARILSN